MSPVARSGATALGARVALEPLHVGPAPPFLPHWAVLVVATVSLGTAILVGVALADRLLDRLVA